MREGNVDTTTSLTRPRVLVVEDEANVRNFCERLLRFNKYEATAAEHGQAAVEMLRHTQFDLVLTDLHMPGMGGIELLQYLHDHHPDIDTIVFTAYAEVETARQALKLGAFDYLTKPLDADDLERTVRKCLEMRRIRKEKERLSDLLAMHRFSQAIANSLDIDTQTKEIVAFLWQRFAPESLSVSLLYPDDGELRLLIHETRHDTPAPARCLSLDPDCSEAALNQAHLRLIGAAKSDRPTPVASAILRTHDQPIGCLYMTRSVEQPEFDSSERTLLDVFASQIAASLDNARLYHQLKEQNLETMAALAAAIEARDPYTLGHSEQVTHYAVRLAEVLGLAPDRIELLRYAGLMHDVGKIGIRDHILLKPSPLSDEEFAVMQSHPLIGANIIRNVRALRATLPIIEGHHECVDGGGYPSGLSGEQLSLETRILAIADAFDAMTSDRAYRTAMDTETALAILIEGKGRKWDAQLVDAFVELIRTEGDALKTKLDLCPRQEAYVEAVELLVSR